MAVQTITAIFWRLLEHIAALLLRNIEMAVAFSHIKHTALVCRVCVTESCWIPAKNNFVSFLIQLSASCMSWAAEDEQGFV